MVNVSKSGIGYTGVAKLLHWLVVLLLCVQYVAALNMPHIGRNPTMTSIISFHISLGLLIFVVLLVRLIWRWTHAEPPPQDGLPPWQLLTAKIAHGALYALLLIIPMLGWLNASFRGFDLTFFGLFGVPRLVAPRSPGFAWTGDVHIALSYYFFLPIAGLHIAAALYHHFIKRDGVLGRMLPEEWM
jgi:cytochrome b561